MNIDDKCHDAFTQLRDTPILAIYDPLSRARWALELENYNCSVQHRPGSKMSYEDALSRCQIISVISSEDIDFQLRATQNRDPFISQLKVDLVEMESKLNAMQDGLVFRRNRKGDLHFYVPREMEENFIRHI